MDRAEVIAYLSAMNKMQAVESEEQEREMKAKKGK